MDWIAFVDSRAWNTLGPVFGLVIGGFATYKVEIAKARDNRVDRRNEAIMHNMNEILETLMSLGYEGDAGTPDISSEIRKRSAKAFTNLRLLIPLEYQESLGHYMEVTQAHIRKCAAGRATEHDKETYRMSEDTLIGLIQDITGNSGYPPVSVRISRFFHPRQYLSHLRRHGRKGWRMF